MANMDNLQEEVIEEGLESPNTKEKKTRKK